MAHLVFYNPNPYGAKVGDCVVRAIAIASDQDWDTTYTGLTFQGFVLKDMPSSNYVWGEYLKSLGFRKRIIDNDCIQCYTVADFADEHRSGAYVVGTGTHAVAVVDGDVVDIWDSRNENPVYYYEKEEK